MYSSNKNKYYLDKKGFSLIELLSVIIIIGILAIIAIPNISEYLSDSRKSTYIATAQQYIDSAKSLIETDKIPISSKNSTYYIPISCIPLEKGGESPFGELEEAYVVATYNGKKHSYYFTSRDSAQMGILLTSESLLDEDYITSGMNIIDTSVGVGDRENIIILGEDCTISNGEELAAYTSITENGRLEN